MDPRPTAMLGERVTDRSKRVPTLAAGLGLLAMAVLAPIAQFGVLQTLIIPADPAATVSNIAASPGQFWVAIVAFLIVAILDVVVAWGLYVLLRSADVRVAQLVAVLRVVYAVLFAYALLGLFNAAQLIGGASAADLQSEQLRTNVASSIGSFNSGWNFALGIFGVHLVALGILLLKFLAPRWLAALVVLAGVGYLIDSIATMFVSGYTLKIATYTFIGEAILIFWLLWIAFKGVRRTTASIAVPAG